MQRNYWLAVLVLGLSSGCGGGSVSPAGRSDSAAPGLDSRYPGSDLPYVPPRLDANPGADHVSDCGDACPGLDAGPLCGNGILELGETCDDSNARPGDGCSGLCHTEPNYTCPVVGQPCIADPFCGDSHVTGTEVCDDGNTRDGDGCSSTCQLESSSICDGGADCGVQPACGDGIVNQGETCDDGDTDPGDGCSGTCQVETGWICPTANQPCVRDEYCGDGNLSTAKGEQCDDGNSSPGDGCTGACQKEPFYDCPVPGQKCVSTIVCGDSKVVADEACDDGNVKAGDGCSADCKQVEPGYTCPKANAVGGPCTLVPEDRCGDARLSYGETCDDGNSDPGDGCSATCRVETGYRCPEVGKACVLVAVCGDGKLSLVDGEQCDDGDKVSGNGCSATCQVEANYVCLTPGEPCQSTVVCGDRKITGTETCDDGNTHGNDGCSMHCQVETGWTCPAGSVCRPTKCGDSIRVGTETCDDGNAVSDDGCSSQCRLETPGPTEGDGWMCPTVGQPCVRTTCGNGIPEGSEQCDDGNNDTGDGCSPYCRKEPSCPAASGGCTTACGDGILLEADKPGQECDDGNTVSGDGCSGTCKVESGHVCTSTAVVQDPLMLPIIYRDFKGVGEEGNHPDFESVDAGVQQCTLGISGNTLGTDGKPVPGTIAQSDTSALVMTYATGTAADWFHLWYRDSEYSKTTRDFLTFTKLASGVYQYDDAAFFPLDGKGWGNTTGQSHNFHFTSEVRYWFEYRGGEKLEFTGDDDVFVYINKKLAVDLGGVHGALTGSVVLDASNGTGVVHDMVPPSGTTNCKLIGGAAAPAAGNTRTVNFGLTKGSVYEIVVFQAERHTTESHYRLTLSNFTANRSACHTVCGDGVVTPDEACDMGTAKNTGAYGTCNPDCTRPAYCGDGVTNGPAGAEECDNGVNLTSYGGTSKTCGPECKWAPYCGDGDTDTAYGEVCDEGEDNGKGYGHCTVACTQGPRCGDGLVSDSEECDNGVQNGMPGDKCSAKCTWNCGNGNVDEGEQCDEGKAANTGAYGKCKADCTWGPRCGDGIKNGTEQCDDGVNDGSYGACAPGCVYGPRCGDKIVQSTAGEICDEGNANSATAYGKNMCTNRCRPAPYCGDKAVDSTHGEVCDDGVNSGLPGSCTVDCSAFVPLPSCGDHIIQPPEVCDDGANNGTLASPCDSHCRPKCGNGFRDAGEECDDGVNDGSYGTCMPTCKFAAFCGDGVRNGLEQCDQGTANLPSPYGENKCSTFCTNAPYCGDGRIQSEFGEQCEGGALCDSKCHESLIP